MLREWKEKGSGHMVRGLGIPLEHLEKKGEGGYVCDGDSSRKEGTELISAAFCRQQGAMESV